MFVQPCQPCLNNRLHCDAAMSACFIELVLPFPGNSNSFSAQHDMCATHDVCLNEVCLLQYAVWDAAVSSDVFPLVLQTCRTSTQTGRRHSPGAVSRGRAQHRHGEGTSRGGWWSWLVRGTHGWSVRCPDGWMDATKCYKGSEGEFHRGKGPFQNRTKKTKQTLSFITMRCLTSHTGLVAWITWGET